MRVMRPGPRLRQWWDSWCGPAATLAVDPARRAVGEQGPTDCGSVFLQPQATDAGAVRAHGPCGRASLLKRIRRSQSDAVEPGSRRRGLRPGCRQGEFWAEARRTERPLRALWVQGTGLAREA